MFNKKVITNGLSKLTRQEQKVAHYAIEKGFEIVNISINDIYKETQTSLATVNRTFSKLGFGGLKYYKMFIFSKINEKVDKDNEFNFDEDSLMTSLKNTFSTVDAKLVDKVAKLLIDKNKEIIILAEGFSLLIAQIFRSKLMKIFFDVKLFDEQLYGSMVNCSVLVIFSTSMHNKTLFRKIEMLKNINKKIKIVIFTTNCDVKNDSNYDYVVCGNLIENYKMNSQELPSDSLVVLLSLSNIVFDQIYLQNEEEYKNFVDKIK